MRILLSIPSLALGGAERQYAELARGLSARGHEVLCAVLGQGGPLEGELGGARLALLEKRSRLDNPRMLLRLAGLVRSFRPRAHYAFLSTPCVLGALLKPLFPATKLVMGVRATPVDHADYSSGRAGALLHRLEAGLSGLADLVICNSEAGRAHAAARGMAAHKLRVVPNGIDTARCRPDRALGLPLREEWGAAPEAPLIGIVARLDPMKDHANFLKAAALVAMRRPEARFVCVGGGPEGYASELRRQAGTLGLGEKLTWAGARGDMTAVNNALDLLCLASAYGEGFPNVLGEAMACGVPCATTDVGDAAPVVGDAGAVAPRRDHEALAGAMLAQLERLEREGAGLRRACRQRVEANFSVERMVERTEALLLELAGERP